MKVENIRDFVDNQIEGLSNFEKRVMIDNMISELREIREGLTEGSYVERQKKRKEEIVRFFEDVGSMRISEKVALKRTLGVKDDFEGMYRLLNNKERYNISTYEKPIWALCARIYCLFECKQSDKTFATCVGEEVSSASGTAKFENMLATSTDKFDYLSADMIRFVRQLKSKNKTFDCKALLLDMLNWNHSNKSVQMKWVQDFYNAQFKN